jgi:hypothetical protein
MKRFFLMIIASAMFLLSSPAYADTVTVSTENTTHFQGPQTIRVDVGGRICNLIGSAAGGGAFQGCNYRITLSPNGTITGESLTPQGCTPSAQIPASCK